MEIKNLIVFCIPIALFFYWMTIGYATLCLLRTQRHTLQNLLLAPTVGLAINVLPLFWLNRLGFGTLDFAVLMSTLLFIGSIFILLYYRPIYHTRYFFFIIILMLALFLNGRPLLQFGFNWLSYGNDDMANYCLRAMRYLHYGYITIPDTKTLVSGQDYSLSYWFWDALTSYRAGSELLLAWISALTKINPLKLFMPLILAFLLCLISTTGALLFQSKKNYATSLATCFLLACSGLTTLGVLYQLLAQVIGTTLLISILVVALQPFSLHQRNNVLRQSLLIGLLFSTFMICYPELSPFLGLSVLLYFIICFSTGWKPQRQWWIIILGSVFSVALFVNTHLISTYFFLKIQAMRGLNTILNDVFPYFLSVKGLAYLWGLQVVSKIPSQSMILMGSSLLFFTLMTNLKQFKERTPVAIVLGIMICFSVFLLKNHLGFAIFKLAMYAQPFLIGGLALGLFQIIKFKKARILIISLIAGFFIMIQYQYVNFSTGKLGSPFVEMVNASPSKLVSELDDLDRQLNTTANVIVDTPNMITAKLLALYLIARKTSFYSKDFFYNSVISVNQFEYHYINRIVDPKITAAAHTMEHSIKDTLIPSRLLLQNIIPPLNTLLFYHSNKIPDADTKLIISSPLRSIFNRAKFSKDYTKNFALLPWSKAINYLILTNSNYGKEYYSSEFTPVSIYNLEPDYFNIDHSVAAIGRYLLFRVVNPTTSFRMALTITKSFGANNMTPLPQPRVIGADNATFAITGSGSARVYSSLITPQYIDHIPYILLDMGSLNTDTTLQQNDFRKILAYSRDISLLSETEYQHLPPITEIRSFPDDLLQTALEYSGLYEDGFVSDNAYVYLHQPKDSSQLIIRGLIHNLHQNKSLLSIVVDHVLVKKAWLIPGEFSLQILIPKGQTRKKVELHFSNSYILPNNDNRRVGALLNYIGFESEKDYLKLKPPFSISHFPNDLDNHELKYFNIFRDGWIAANTLIYLSQPKVPSVFVFDGFIPEISNKHFQSQLTILLDKQIIAKKTLKPGHFNIQIPMTTNKAHRTIALQFSNTQDLPNKDDRNVAALISFLGFKESKTNNLI